VILETSEDHPDATQAQETQVRPAAEGRGKVHGERNFATITQRRITSMRASHIIIVLSAIIMLVGVSNAQNKFVGVKTCAMCHKSGKAGAAYVVWEKGNHASAYKTLLGEKANKIAVKSGLKGPPSQAPECLKCHVTGGGIAKNLEASFKMEEGVTCEACHGAASAFKIVHSKGDLAKSKQAGLNPGEKTEKFCTTCHNPESPTFKGFKLDEMWAKIEHGLPAKK
jgi:hypothetical protein